MHRVLTASVAGATLLCLALAGPLAQAKSGGVAAIPLNAEQEVPGSESAGSGFFSYSVDGDELCYTLSVAGLEQTPTAAHIHLGDRGVAGGVVVPLVTPPSPTSTVSDCILAAEGGALTPAELAAIVASPRSHYVNVHTAVWPAGAVRGQLK